MLRKIRQLTLGLITKNKLFLTLVIICIIQGVVTPRFLSIDNALNVARHASYIGIVSIGMTIVILSGGIDLSLGSVLALSGCFLAGLQVFSGWSLGAALIGGFLLVIMAGTISGSMISYLRVPAFVATLSGLFIYRGIVLVYTKQVPVSGLSPLLSFWGVGNLGGIPISVVIWLLIAIGIHFMLRRTTLGETMYAIGSNELVAKLSGLNVRFCRTIGYIFSALLAGLTGVLLTARLDSAQPVMGQGWELDAIACSIVGGTSLMGGVASIPNVILGTLIITVIRTGLNMIGMAAEFQLVVIGFVLITVVGLDMLKYRGE